MRLSLQPRRPSRGPGQSLGQHHGAKAAPKLTSKREKGAQVDGCYCSLLSWVHLFRETPVQGSAGPGNWEAKGIPQEATRALASSLSQPASWNAHHPSMTHAPSPSPACVRTCLSHFSHDSDPGNCSPTGSSVQGILQARILEWVALPSSRGSS